MDSLARQAKPPDPRGLDSARTGSPWAWWRARTHEPRPTRRHCCRDDSSSAQSGRDGNDGGHRRAGRPLVTSKSPAQRCIGPPSCDDSPEASAARNDRRTRPVIRTPTIRPCRFCGVRIGGLWTAVVGGGRPRSVDQLEVDVEGTVGFGGAAVAGGKRDPVFGCCSSDERVVNSAAGNAERCQPGMQ
jgi:hypothetical protein